MIVNAGESRNSNLDSGLENSWIMRGVPVSGTFGEQHRRRPLSHSSYVRSPYALEYNPWTSTSEIEKALFYRGVIVSAFGQIETKLSEIAIRASLVPEFLALRSTFPRRVEQRIAFLRRVFEIEPMVEHQSVANAYLDRFVGMATLRHMMAHGRMQVMGGGLVTLHDFPRSDGASVVMRRQSFTFAGLEILAWRSAKLARAGHKLLARLEALKILPALEIAGG